MERFPPSSGVGVINHPVTPATLGDSTLAVAAAEARPAHEADDLRCALRHARIPPERAREFWDHVVTLLHEFAQLPRSGDTAYGFAVGLYPTDHPTLPERDDSPLTASRSSRRSARRGTRR